MSTQAARARGLRRSSTDAEQRLWSVLRARRSTTHKFRRQEPIGRYIVDFVCYERRLIIEVDGAHHYERPEDDAARTAWLRGEGYEVLRFSDREVLIELQGVQEALGAGAWRTPLTLTLSPKGRGDQRSLPQRREAEFWSPLP